MKKSAFIFGSLIFLAACTPKPQGTTPVTGQTSATTTSGGTIKTTPVDQHTPVSFVQYNKNPLAGPLLSADELKAKKLYTSLAEALADPQNVYRLELKKREEGFELGKLTPRIGELYNLQKLDLFGIYKDLPKEIGMLTQLQEVELTLPYLSSDLPQEIANWKNIKRFTLRMHTGGEPEAKIQSLQSLTSLSNLEELTLDGNNLATVPSKLGQLKKLKKLSIQFSPLKSLPQDLKEIPNLEFLKLSGLAQLESVPALSPSLKEVEMRNLDQLTDLSQSFGSAQSLEVIRMFSFGSLTVFPANFGELKKLKAAVLGDFPHITQLPALKNPVLKELYVYNFNAMTAVSENIYGAEMLEYLHVKTCPKLAALPDFKKMPLLFSLEFSELPNMKVNDPKYNQTIKKINGVEVYSYLKQLDQNDLFATSEDLYYRYINKVHKLDVTPSIAIRTKNKSQVKKVAIELSINKDTVNLFLQNLNQFPQLEELNVYFDEKSSFPAVSLTKKIALVRFAALAQKDEQVNWVGARNFLGSLKMDTLYLASVSKTLLEGEYTNLGNLKKLDIDGVGQYQTATDISRLISSCVNLEELRINVATAYVPAELFTLSKLKKLDITVWDPLKDYTLQIPASIATMTDLESVKIYLNDFEVPVAATVDPAINTLKKLRVMDLYIGGDDKKSKAFTYPSGIENLSSLQVLKLSLVKEIPAGVEKLSLKEKHITVARK